MGVLHQRTYLALQRGDVLRLPGLEIQFRLRRRERLPPVQQVVLLRHLGRLLHHICPQPLHQCLYSAVVLVHVDILVPIHPHCQFILVYPGHPFLLHEKEHPHAQGHRHRAEQHRQTLVGKHPVYPGIIKAVQRVPLQGIADADARQPPPMPPADACAIDQVIENRQKQDAREVGSHLPHRHRERLVVEQRPADAAHEYQRDKDCDGRERRTNHGRQHFLCACHASPAEAVAPLAVLRDVLRHDDAVVYHHSQGQNQARQRDDVQRQAEQIEEDEPRHQRHQHAQPDDERRLHIAQEQHRKEADE